MLPCIQTTRRSHGNRLVTLILIVLVVRMVSLLPVLSLPFIMEEELTPRQRYAIQITERVGSALSLLGSVIIIVSFLTSSRFRKPINRLIFYASWGNTLCTVATLTSYAGIHAGQRSALCQVQAFLIQWHELMLSTLLARKLINFKVTSGRCHVEFSVGHQRLLEGIPKVIR